ncbi:hypothetical protein BDW69DRAFT_190451 [Aspergillus filifer]
MKDLQYIIYITFPHPGLDLTTIARAFTAAVAEHLAAGPKTINFEFHAASLPSQSQSFGSILSSHRTLLVSRPELTVGRLPSPQWAQDAHIPPGTGITPPTRIEETPE